MSDKCNCYRFSPRDSLSGAVAQIADYLSKHPGWNETELRAFVDGLISPTGVESFNGRTGTVTLDKNDVNDLKIASAYFARVGESIDSIDLVSLYNQGVRFVFTDFNSDTHVYNLAFALEYLSGSGEVVYYPMSTCSGGGGNIVSVNGKTGEVHLKVVDVSNGNSPDENAYIFIDESDDYPDVISSDSYKLGGQLPSYYALAEDVAAITPDDTVVDGKPWTSKKIVDAMCMPIEATGNPVQVYPVESYPLGVKVSWEPTQEGSGDPSPENIRPITGQDGVSITRCGKNLLSIADVSDYSSWRADLLPDGDFPTNIGNRAYELPVSPGTQYTIMFDFGEEYPTYLYLIKSVGGVSSLVAYITTDKIEKRTETFLPKDGELYYLRMGECFTENLFKQQIGKIASLQLETGSIATPYEPYTGSTTDIALPETVYGGEVNTVSGLGNRTWRTITLTGEESSHIYENLFYLDLYKDSSFVQEKAASLTSGKSSHYKYLTYNEGCIGVALDGGAVVYSANGKYPISNEGIQEWKAYLAAQYAAGTPVQVCYKLAEPVPFTATGTQQIAALSDVNTLYTDAGTLTVTGREDPRHTIVELKNAIISLGGNI